jgi:putative ABC transport system ATP-binding protein
LRRSTHPSNKGRSTPEAERGKLDGFGSTEWRGLLRFDRDAPLLRLDSVTRHYSILGRRIPALLGVTFTVGRGELLGVVGPSGSGKSTLLNSAAGLLRPSSGRVLFKGLNIYAGEEPVRRLIREEFVGVVPQEINLIRFLSARENVELPMDLMGISSDERHRRAEALLEEVGLEDRAEHKPGEMSLGEQQRVAIARSLVLNPVLVLADEPTANLDTETARRTVALLARLREERGTTFIFATHDPEITTLCDRTFLMRDGEIRDMVIPAARSIALTPEAFLPRRMAEHLRDRFSEHLSGLTYHQGQRITVLDTPFTIKAPELAQSSFHVRPGTGITFSVWDDDAGQ